MSAGRIPDETIDAVLKHHDIVDVVGKYVHLTKQGRNLAGLCPFHSEKSPSFFVVPEKQIFICYGCKAAGNAIIFIRDIEGLSYVEAVRQLAEEAGIAIGTEALTPEQAERRMEFDWIVKAHEFAARLYHYILLNTEQGKEALQYLRARGFSDQAIEAFQLGYAPARRDTLANLLANREFPMSLMEKGALVSARAQGEGYADKFYNRIMFPIRDARGSTIAFAGRAMGDERPKYLNSPETSLFRKSKVLYHFHAARQEIKKTSQVVLFEGYADVIKAWGAGVVNGAATMGTSLTEDHARLIRRIAEQVVLCYDGDDAGQSASFRSISLLEKAGLDIRVAVIPDKLDPDDYIEKYGAERFRRDILQRALTHVKFKLVHLRRNFNMHDNEAKRRYVQTVIREVIAPLESPTERDFYLKELAAEFSAISSYETMKQEMFEMRSQLQKKRFPGDNTANSWNNVRNDEMDSVPLPKLKPAYDKAERHLLYTMAHDRETADYVQERLGEAFNDEDHAAIAAYLYAYYAKGNDPDPSRFMSELQSERLERLVSSILISESDQGINAQVIDDYLKQIHKHRFQQDIERMEQEMKRAESDKDYMRAAQIAIEITTLKNQLRAM